MAEIRQTFTADDTGLIAALKEIKAQTEANTKAIEEMGETQKKASKEAEKAIEDNNKALDESVEAIGKKVKATEADEKATNKWGNSLKDAANEVNIAGVNVGGLVDKLKAKSAALKSVTSGVTGTSKALRAFKVALASTGIGLLVVALGSLVAYFQRSQKGIDTFNRGMSRVSAAVNVVIDRFATLGGGVRKMFELDFSGAIAEFRKSFKGIGAEISEEASAAGELTGRLQQIRKELVAVNIARSEQSKEIERLKMQSDDTNRSTEERIRLAREAFAMETTGLEKELQLKRENYDLEEQLAKQGAVNGEIRIEEQERLAGLKAEINDLEKGSLTLQTELNNKINSLTGERAALMDQERAKVKALDDAYAGLVDKIEQQLLAQELNKLNSRERLVEERKLALQEIDLLEQKAKAAALAAGEEYTLADKFLQIRQNINGTYAEQARELSKVDDQVNRLNSSIDATADMIYEKLGRQITPFGTDPGAAESAGEKTLEQIAAGAKKGIEKNKDLFNEIRVTMMSWMGLDGEQMKELENSVITTFDIIGELYTNSINRQLDENQRLIDSLRERESIIQDELEYQMELREQGRSNNVESKRLELEEIRKEEEKAHKQAEELRRRQQAAELAANLARQASNLATAISEIYKANAGIPAVGLIAAGVSVAAMLAAFANARAQASNVIGQRAYKGGSLSDYIDGEGNRRSGMIKPGGRSDIPGHGDGYRILGTDVVVGGDEYLVNENTSRRHVAFLDALNAGKYDNVDLSSIAKFNGLSDMAGLTYKPPLTAINRLNEMHAAKGRRISSQRMDGIVAGAAINRLDAINQNLRTLIERSDKILSLEDYKKGYVVFSGKDKKIIRK